MKKASLKKITFSGVFLGIGLVLPLFTAQIKEIGDTLLPMHIPVLLCGILCGAPWGAAVGLILPFLRSMLFSMPPIYPNACWMAVELAVYGISIGFIYNKLKFGKVINIYISLISAQILGRIAWGVAKSLLLMGTANAFSLSAFFIGGFVDAFLGIVLQWVLIPAIVAILNKFEEKNK